MFQLTKEEAQNLRSQFVTSRSRYLLAYFMKEGAFILLVVLPIAA